MASSAVHLDGGSGASSPTGFTTASVTPTAASLQLMTITIARGSSTQPTAPTVPGFTQQGSAIDYDVAGSTRASKFLFRAIGSSLSPGTIAVTFGYTAQNYAYEWDEIPNVPTTGTNGADAIVQHVQASGSSNNPHATLAAFSSASNGTYGSSGAQALPATTAEGTGFTLLGKHSNTATVTVSSISDHRDDNDTSPDTNLGSSNVWGFDAIEVAFSGSITASPTATTLTITADAPTATGTASTTPAAAVLTVAVPNPTAVGGGAGDITAFPDPVLLTFTVPNPSASGATAATATPPPVVITVGTTPPFTYLNAAGDPVYTATVFLPTDLTAPIRTLRIVGGSLSWEEQLSEPGSGAWTSMMDDPQPTKGDLVQMAIGGIPVWTAIANEFVRNPVDENGAGSRKTAWSNCPGHMAQWADAQVWPANSLNSKPKQHDMTWDWTHPDYDDWWWVVPVVFTHTELTTQWTGALWDPDFPVPESLGLAAPGDTTVDAQLGRRFFRQPIDAPEDREYFLYWGADDAVKFYVDGVQIIDSDEDQNFTKVNLTQFDMTAGPHMFAWECVNLDRAFVGANPTACRWTLLKSNTAHPTVTEHVACSTPGPQDNALRGARMVGPNEIETHFGALVEPGMTPGNMVRLMLESFQARGLLTHWRLSCSDINDSYGVPWTATPPANTSNTRIATKILTDGLTVVREVSGSYWDARADPRDFVLNLFNKDTMNAVDSGQSFLPADNATVLTQRSEYKPTNALVVEYNDRYVLVEDTASIAEHGRHEGRLALGAVDGEDEAVRVGLQALADYAQPREEIQVQIRGPIPYFDYDLGTTATTINSLGDLVSEKITAQAVSSIEATGGIIGTPTLKDLFFR